MKQQDFWTWADKEAEKSAPSRGGGRLFLSELPTDLGLSLPEIQKLHEALQERLGTVDLVLTDNRRRMVSAKHRRKRFRLRVHHMFVGCSDAVVDALANLASGQKKEDDGSRQRLKDYISNHRDSISYDVDPEKLEAQGEHHDLQAMLDKWRAEMKLDVLEDVVITWGRYGKGSRTIRFGSYDFDRKLIRMHPALDQSWVPDFFVEFIVYHELLHALFPPKKKSSRRIVHPPEFREMEEMFPRYEEAMIWERRNLSRFLES